MRNDVRRGGGKAPGVISAAVLAAVLALAAPAGPAAAQNLFAPRLYVNGQVITDYEVIQRALFLQLLRAPGDPEEEALKALTDDRLRMAEASRLDITATPEEVAEGMEEFAGRANLTAEQLIGELQKLGIGPETFRDFVTAGLVWRKVVRARYVGAVPISEADVDRALEAAARPRALKVLVSELVIPMQPGAEDAAMALANRLSQEIDTEGEFAAAARSHSASPTAGSGGRLEWMALANLPGPIAGEILALGKGDVSAPVQVPGAVVLFQLRDLARDDTAEPVAVNVEWADYRTADPAEAARVRAGADECNDLYGLVRGQPAEVLTIRTDPAAALPQDAGLALAQLDPGEVAVLPGRLVMLCSRRAVSEAEPDRDAVREQVINQKLEGLAEGYLEELRFAALIREP